MYAVIIKAHGSTVDRRTNNYASKATLARGLRRELRSMPGAGPFIVHTYGGGRLLSVTQEL